MAKAFLSHSSSDKSLVRKIANLLGNQRCVLDENSFEPGAKTLDEIFRELDESDVFVLFISDKALNSEWVQTEINLAYKALSEDKLDRILPIIIDEKVDYTDPRIPKWLSKDYNLRYIKEAIIIYHKIRDALYDVRFKRSEHNQALERIFVGRNEEMARFERDVNNLEGWTPTFIIAYNFYQGIGRSTFLKNALLKAQFISKLSSHKPITLDRRESIESFIYKLNAISEDEEIFKSDLSKKTMDEKVAMAVAQVKSFMQNKEIIFIEDNGGIILPNKEMAPWFKQVAHNKAFENNLVFCIISKFRPDERKLEREKRSLVYMIPELKKEEYKSLFIKLLKIYGHDDISTDDKKFFLEHLKGIPAQIIYAVKMIDINLFEAKKGIKEIDEFADKYSKILLEKLREMSKAYQIALMLSQNEVFSMSLIKKVFGENDDTMNAMQILIDLSVVSFLFGGYEYLSLNSALADYIRRSRIQIDSNYNRKLNEEIKRLLKKDLGKVLINDYSAFMLTLQNMLKEGKNIPSKYFMPSLLLKNVIVLYDQGKCQQVIDICERLLNDTNYDEQIMWETRYWQTAAMAKCKDRRVLDNLKYFKYDSVAQNFLKGFYYRHVGEKVKALDCFYRVLEKDKTNAKSKREIVNILLSQGKYSEALDMAKDNYSMNKTNIYHIHSYFICLIRRKEYLIPQDIKVLDSLLESMKDNVATKAEDMARCMEGEYAYYVKNDINRARDILKKAIEMNEDKSYPKKSLFEIYRTEKRLPDFYKLGIDLNSPAYEVEDFE